MSDQNEKAEEKRQEKSPSEKRWDEKDWRADPLSSIIWALILIWAGIVLLLYTLSIPGLPHWTLRQSWGVILIGAGLVLGLEISIRLANPSYAAPLRGRAILATILLLVGASNLFDFPIGPAVLIILGFAALLSALRRPR